MMPVVGPPRWEEYVLAKGVDFTAFWTDHAKRAKRILWVLGQGFDPRMCVGLEAVAALPGAPPVDVVGLEFDEGSASPSWRQADAIRANRECLQKLVSPPAVLSTRQIRMFAGDGRRVGSKSAAAAFEDAGELAAYSDVVVDISALPRGIYFPLVAKLLHLRDAAASAGWNLHVVVAENTGIEARIRDEGVLERADYVFPFHGGMGLEATAENPRLWIPVLGEGQAAQLERVHDLVRPDEVCPVIPFPASNPRRGDDIVLEYRDFLFDRLRVEPRNIVYASEKNPFQVYRQLRSTILRYHEALRPLGDCKTVISALTTKLLSIGPLLVAYEFTSAKVDVAIAHVEVQGYVLEDSSTDSDAPTELVELWLAGECYA
jgi:hypothetical protein